MAFLQDSISDTNFLELSLSKPRNRNFLKILETLEERTSIALIFVEFNLS